MNVLVVLGTLLGAVVLGAYPALAAGGGLLGSAGRRVPC